MSRNANEAQRLRELMEKLEAEKKIQERESRKAKFPALIQLAITAMKFNRERTWNSTKGAADAAKKAELDKKVKDATEEFVKTYREIVRNDLGRWWGAALQKEYIKGAPEALLTYYLSDNPEKTKPLAYFLKKAADDYIRGWELLGNKNRKELSGPIDVVGNGDLAVQTLIEQLRAGDELQKTQAKILELVFEDPISALGKKAPETSDAVFGKALREVLQETSD